MGDIDTIIGGNNGETFFQHVFNFDEPSKREMMNIVQYTVVALVPIVMLNKLMQKYVPEADDEKGSLELLAEVVIQTVFMFVGILIINRAVTFVPPYSGTKYEQFSIIHMIPATLIIILSLQTKLGEKVSILYDRIEDLIMGKKEGVENMNNPSKKDISSQQNVANQSNPLVNASSPSMPVNSPGMPMSQSTQATGVTGIQSLRQDPVNSGNQGGSNQYGGEQDAFEPMAANAMGGGAFGSLW
jgi:hypothetical protein